MKATGGKANPAQLNELLKKKLAAAVAGRRMLVEAGMNEAALRGRRLA